VRACDVRPLRRHEHNRLVVRSDPIRFDRVGRLWLQRSRPDEANNGRSLDKRAKRPDEGRRRPTSLQRSEMVDHDMFYLLRVRLCSFVCGWSRRRISFVLDVAPCARAHADRLRIPSTRACAGEHTTIALVCVCTHARVSSRRAWLDAGPHRTARSRVQMLTRSTRPL
jgi:hypothetical protein